jgi:hypothetical protein
VIRLACFGDSFTFGSETSDEGCWPAQIEERMPSVEALNLGVAG